MSGTHSVVLAPRIFFAHLDISGDANAHGIGQTVNLPQDSRYGDTNKRRLIGSRDMSFSIAGNVDLSGASDQDTIVQSKLAVNNVPLIISTSATVGDQCEFGLVALGQYTPQAKYDDVLKYSATGAIAKRRWVMGKVLWSPDTAISGTADGAEVSLGAVSSTQKLYVAIAVFAANFSDLQVKVQSDTTGFGSPTDQRAFTAAADVTSEMPVPVDGAITDTFFRASVSSFTGTSAQMIVVAGVA